jgi:hypothetical protein
VAVLALDVRDPDAGDVFPGIFHVDPHACPMIMRVVGKIETVVAGQDAGESNLA